MMNESKKDEALKYYDKLLEELNTLNLDPETSELYKFVTNTINRAEELTNKLPASLLEMIK